MGVDGMNSADIFDEYFDDEKPKYIIRKCPAFVLMRTATSGTYFNICGTAKGHVECKDRTDCLLKRIAELLKNPNNCRYSGKPLAFTDDILALLDIQEILE